MWLIGIGVARGGHVAQISSISCHFVFREAASQTKCCCSLKFKIFGTSQNFELAAPLLSGTFPRREFPYIAEFTGDADDEIKSHSTPLLHIYTTRLADICTYFVAVGHFSWCSDLEKRMSFFKSLICCWTAYGNTTVPVSVSSSSELTTKLQNPFSCIRQKCEVQSNLNFFGLTNASCRAGEDLCYGN